MMLRDISLLVAAALVAGCSEAGSRGGTADSPGPRDAPGDSWTEDVAEAGGPGLEIGPESAPEPAPEMAIEQGHEPAPEPVPDAMPEPTPDVAPESAPEPVPEPVTDAHGGAEAHDDSGVLGPDATGGPVTVTATLGGPGDAATSYLMDGPSGEWNLFGPATVHLGRHWDEAHVSYHTALRFPGLDVPAGAVIESATLSFFATNEVDSSNALILNVYAEAAADSAPFDVTRYESGRPDQRARTTAHVEKWVVRCNESCSDLTEWDCPQRKLDCWDREVAYACPKDLAALVQEVVSGPGWSPGNALTLLLVNAATAEDGSQYEGARSVTGFDPERGASYSPRLTVRYVMP